MPTPAYFSKYPEFPSDISVAKLPVLSLSKLLSNDEVESDALFEASRTLGFFLIDLSDDSSGEGFLRDTERIFDLNEELHNLSTDELMKYAYKWPTSLFG
jgi:hypothetical protein